MTKLIKPFSSKFIEDYVMQLVLSSVLIVGGLTETWSQSSGNISWKQAQRQEAQWYASEEAQEIADNVLLYQNHNGGWLKNKDMAQELNDEKKRDLEKQKSLEIGTTIDNGATHTQMRYLAKVYKATGNEAYKNAFLKGVDYLLAAQYDNGGWPQYYPIRKGYYEHITFNDGAMIGVMSLLRDIARQEEVYGFVNSERRKKSRQAIDKGLEAILEMQVEVDGKLTVWCAQHDKETLEPAKARAYELPSLSGGESAGIVKYLMRLKDSGEAVKKSIKSAVQWFENSKIEGKRVVKEMDDSLPKGYDRIVVDDSDADPLWGRFYEIETNRPIFVGRDGIIKYSLAEIEHERRVGYSYLSNYGGDLLERDFPKWAAQVSGK